MKGFRRAQLRGSDELFRATDDNGAQQELIAAVDVPSARVSAVPAAPRPDLRSVRLTHDEIQVLADAIQHLKFPHQAAGRPSVERFEELEALRHKLLDAL